MSSNDKNNKISAADLFAALKEKNITAEEVAAELNIIFEDYFSGASLIENGRLVLKFLNGQSFEIKVNEIKG